ncbi:rRNA maturation RNase YbeY [Zeaxanthinibacter sp. PT1]|uniref:rRNA maturation RNase YbeY n=1 Tax=Zeaxanthinibacter TaxID=561554 RepID=UPI00234A9AD4|nr:rRNA maturation RNase YbeY [Zeaxanthinibacter sp. PT1]MDC6350637.1 rRNA maturation RNase YbeY [Zeaxanthinibacter sp. PT1]
MIEYHYQTDFTLEDEQKYTEWLERVIYSENHELESVNFIFCDDDQLLAINLDHLGHDYFTDIITFEYGDSGNVFGDVFISVDRVEENAKDLQADQEEEMRRVMCHGLLHMMGFGDKTKAEKQQMRDKENEKLGMFHVEQ